MPAARDERCRRRRCFERRRGRAGKLNGGSHTRRPCLHPGCHTGNSGHRAHLSLSRACLRPAGLSRYIAARSPEWIICAVVASSASQGRISGSS
jgi:hypothetical protein